jgi:ATP synthase subunit 6
MYLFNFFIYSPLEQFEISTYNTGLRYTWSYPIHLFETKYRIINFVGPMIFDALNWFSICTGIAFFIFTLFFSKTFSDLKIVVVLIFTYIISFNIPVLFFWNTQFQINSTRISPKNITHFKENCDFSLPTSNIQFPTFFQDSNQSIFEKLVGEFTSNLTFVEPKVSIAASCIFKKIDSVTNDFIKDHLNFLTITQDQWNIKYISYIASFLNIYSIAFCFIFSFAIIYLIYNKLLSNNTNTLIPNIFQIIAQILYVVSYNLFQSILGKHVSNPELFIKINTIFIFLLISNMQGMIPYMSTLTSALTNTFFIALALFISLLTLLIKQKGPTYFLNLFLPPGCPIALSLLIIPIELISYSFRLVSLSVRLFANMMAGHTLLKVIVGFSWTIIFFSNSLLLNMFPFLTLFVLTLLEFGVAIIQAYIFTVLSCIYLRDIYEGH